ncbi:glycosyltransferase family 4 protein, partial [bacterium]|nr:glycosyltransferase family 4 protein [bacterium]
MKVAVIHDWLVVVAGAERVLEEILKIFPQADLFCLLDFLPTKERGGIDYRKTTTSFIQNLPFAKTKYRLYLPLMPLAIEQFDLSSYDLIISSSSAVAKGVITGPEQLHVSYVHSPMRYAWDLQFQYLRQAGLEHGIKSWLTRWMLHKMRIWDTRTTHGVDHYIANSDFIAKRIKKIYGRDATVIHPPVDTNFFIPDDQPKEDFYLTVSRLVSYKRIDILVKAFAKLPESRLVIIGSGPELDKLQQLAGKNIELLGYKNNETVKHYMQKARAFLFAAEEDFGIVPLEAQACGTPVIAYGRGGVLETVITIKDASELLPPTGIFFGQQTPEAVTAAITHFETNKTQFTLKACRNNALRFKSEDFSKNLKNFLALKDHRLEVFLAETHKEPANNNNISPFPTIHTVIVDYFKADKVTENLRTIAKQYPQDKISISIVDNSCDHQNTETLKHLRFSGDLNLIVNDK